MNIERLMILVHSLLILPMMVMILARKYKNIQQMHIWV